jgi:hypothetical protein
MKRIDWSMNVCSECNPFKIFLDFFDRNCLRIADLFAVPQRIEGRQKPAETGIIYSSLEPSLATHREVHRSIPGPF